MSLRIVELGFRCRCRKHPPIDFESPCASAVGAFDHRRDGALVYDANEPVLFQQVQMVVHAGPRDFQPRGDLRRRERFPDEERQDAVPARIAHRAQRLEA